MYFIGIDLGTSSVKVVLADRSGGMIGEAGRDYRISQPAGGWKEIWPEIWWEAVESALTELLEHMDASQVEGIGITGQMHTVVMLDQDGKAIRPALMWNDTRTKELVPEMKEKIGRTEVSYINKFISTGSPAANLLWFKENEPELFSRLAHFLIGPDYLVYRFTGVYGTDYCEASTSSLYDLIKREWSPAMRKITGLPESVYPEVRGSAEDAGIILPEIASHFHLNPNAVVITGTGDNPAAAIPTGCLGRGYPVFSMGTSGVLMYPKETPDFDAKGKNILFSFDGKTFHTIVQGVIQSCGSGYSWWNRDILCQDFREADKEIDLNKAGESELLFYPHLVGDKNIYADPELKGAFLGLSTDTGRAEMTQAVMEGIAFGLKQLMEEMQVKTEDMEELKVIGGGSRSRVWMQILADVLNFPVEQMEGNVGAGYGMALLAAYRCGAIPALEGIAKRSVSVKERFWLRAYHAELYRKKYRQYLRIYGAMKTIFAENSV